MIIMFQLTAAVIAVGIMYCMKIQMTDEMQK